LRIVTALLLSIALMMGAAVSASADAYIKVNRGVYHVTGSKYNVQVLSESGIKYTVKPGTFKAGKTLIAPSKGKTYYRTNSAKPGGGTWKRLGQGMRMSTGYFFQVKVV